MGLNLTAVGLSSPVVSPDRLRLVTDRTGQSFVAVQHAALLDYYGSVKEAAYALGEGAGYPRLDESHMQREFKQGNFSKFDRATDAAKAYVATAVQSVFGAATDPRAEMLQRLDAIDGWLKDLRRVIEAQR